MYSESGLGTPFSAVARRAGVGQGSLYRHFPDRTTLAAAVFDENLAELEEYVAPPERTLEDLLDRVVVQAVVSAALLELLTQDRRDARLLPLGQRLRSLIDLVVTREREAGRLAPDADADDVLLATEMLVTAIARSEPSERADVAARARRILRLAFGAA